MDVRAAMPFEGERQARLCEASNRNAGARECKPIRHTTPGTIPGRGGHGVVSEIASGKLQIEHRIMAFTSSGAPVCGRHNRPLPENIIGHGMSVFRERFTRCSVLLRLLRVFPLLHQPARQHGRGIFLHPKVEQRANFLAEIGGMVEPREFKALQRVARSREKELPRGLSFAMVHARLLVAGAGTLTFRYLRSIVPMGH